MKQYCRYCVHAIDYDSLLVCVAKAPCGKDGCGQVYSMEKAKRLNHCKSFEFNSNDLLSSNPDGSFRQYQPREPYKPRQEKIKESGQIELPELRI